MATPATVCILATRLTREMERAIPILLTAGFAIKVGIYEDTDSLHILPRFLENRGIRWVPIEWRGDRAAALNELYASVEEGFIVRLDDDEWFDKANAEKLAATLATAPTKLVGHLLRYHIDEEKESYPKAQTRPLRVWPAGAGVAQIGTLHPRPDPETLRRVTDGAEPTNLTAFFWSLGRENVDISDCERAIALDPTDFLNRTAYARAMSTQNSETAHYLVSNCARMLAAMPENVDFSPDDEWVVANYLSQSPGDDPTTERKLETLALLRFDRSFPVLQALSTRFREGGQIDRALDLALRMQRLQSQGAFTYAYRVPREEFDAIPSLIARTAESLPKGIVPVERFAGMEPSPRAVQIDIQKVESFLTLAKQFGFHPSRPAWIEYIRYDRDARPDADWRGGFTSLTKIEDSEATDLARALAEGLEWLNHRGPAPIPPEWLAPPTPSWFKVWVEHPTTPTAVKGVIEFAAQGAFQVVCDRPQGYFHPARLTLVR